MEVLQVCLLIGWHLKLAMFSSMGFQILSEGYFKANFLHTSLLNFRTNPKQLFKFL